MHHLAAAISRLMFQSRSDRNEKQRDPFHTEGDTSRETSPSVHVVRSNQTELAAGAKHERSLEDYTSS